MKLATKYFCILLTGICITYMPADGYNPNANVTPKLSTATSAGATPAVSPSPSNSTGGTGGVTATPASGGVTPKQTVKGKWQSKTTMGKAGTVLGTVAGAAMVYDATSGQGEHSVTDVVEGTAGGAMTGAALGSVIPGIGTAIGAGIGASVGGIISGSQLFSETDCLHDPVTGKFTCCNTAFTTGERLAKIGDYMFCKIEATGKVPAQYGVRQCLQGGKAKDSSLWDSLWEDDEWSHDCKFRFCGEAPAKGLNTTNILTYTPNTSKFCWNWDCAAGYVKRGNTCEGEKDTASSQSQAPGIDTQLYQGAIAQLEADRARIHKICGPNPNDTSTEKTQSVRTTQQSTNKK